MINIASHNCKTIGKFVSVTKTFYIYEIMVENQKFAFVQVPLGGAGSVQIMEQMIAGLAMELAFMAILEL